MSVSKEKFACLEVGNYTDTRFLNFAIEYLRKNEKFHETIFGSSYYTQVESCKQKNGRKSRDTVPLTEIIVANMSIKIYFDTIYLLIRLVNCT